jgi:hypothetical protein
MGMYTEFHYNTELKRNVPESVIEILRYMLGETETKPKLPEYELFGHTRWESMLQTDSYYFDADTHSTLRYDDVSNSYYLCVRCNLKNYGCEIELFTEWMRPYIDKREGDFLGFSRHESSETPDLIYA